MTDWASMRYAVVDVEGNGQQPPDLVELAVVPPRAGTPDRCHSGNSAVRSRREIVMLPPCSSHQRGLFIQRGRSERPGNPPF